MWALQILDEYKAENNVISDQLHLKTTGERLKYIRTELLRLTRAQIFEKHNLSVHTLLAWENGKIELTEKSIDKCIKIFASENLLVSKAWLLLGEGVAPTSIFEFNKYIDSLSTQQRISEIDDNILLMKEVEYFKSLTRNAIVILMASDDMLPLYAQGDYVGGRFRYGKDIEYCIAKDCIIKTTDGAIYVRRLAKGSSNHSYNLVCLNPAWQGNQEPVLYNVKIDCAAPIIWHRRLDAD